MPRTPHRCVPVILLIDNYDSFTWNLVQCLRTIDPTLDVEVVRNDRITVAEAEALEPDGLMVAQLNREAAGQTVFHYHTHLIPRSQGDSMALHARAPGDSNEISEIASRLVEALDA